MQGHNLMTNRITLLLVAVQASALGQGLLYSFSGHVTDVSQDAAGIISADGIKVGDPLGALFAVDTGRSGRYTQNDGTVLMPSSNPGDTIQYHYYFDELVSALPIRERDGGSRNGPTDVASWNYAYDNFGIAQLFFSMGVLQGGSENAYITITKSDPLDATIATWQVGDSFDLNAWAYDAQNRSSVLTGSVTLSSIDSVPEPRTALLLALGLTLVAGFRLRSRSCRNWKRTHPFELQLAEPKHSADASQLFRFSHSSSALGGW